MLPNTVLKMPFRIKMSSNIWVIRIVSDKICVLLLSRGWSFRVSSHINFCSEGRSFAAFYALRVGILPFKNNSPAASKKGCVNSWN